MKIKKGGFIMTDFTILYAIGLIIVALGIPIGIAYLRKKDIIKVDVDDILLVVTMFNLSLEIIDELNLKQETQIKTIGNILSMTMNYIAETYNDNANMQLLAENYAFGLADKLGLILTEERQQIIKKLIDIGLQTKFN